MRNRFGVIAVGLFITVQAAVCCSAFAQVAVGPASAGADSTGRATSQPAASGTLVLDTTGTWRMFHVLKSPVVQMDGGALKLVPNYEGRPKLDWTDGHRKAYRDILAPETAAVAAGWKDANFDDSDWLRGTAVRAIRSPYLERLYLRGKFEVTDPSKVKALTVSVDFHGGAVVYVNGQEVGRQHMAAPSAGPGQAPSTGSGQAGAAMAEEYPLEAFVGADGKPIGVRGDEPVQRTKTAPEVLKRIESRVRKLSVVVPAGALRRGLNVVGIELVRAPYNKVIDEQPVQLDNHNKSMVPDLSWNTCEIKEVQLRAAGQEGLVPIATRPEGFQLWNSDPLAIDYDMDQGEAGPLWPIRLTGARNGVYSGKVVVGSDKPIKGIAVTAGDLKGPGGTIPAAQVQIRYAVPWGNVILTNPGNSEWIPYEAAPTPLLELAETAPKEVPVYHDVRAGRGGASACLKIPGSPAPVFGAVVPVWVTVRVPKDAKPGTYAGPVTVSAEGLKPTPVAVAIKVTDWTVPSPADRRTWVELIQSPDTLALEYDTPLWSPKHWDLIARSMGYLGQMGSRVLFVPLIANCNAGNDESMVRWIKTGPDKYEYDFSIMDKYLDVAEKQMGKPQVVIFNVWDWYLGGTGSRLYMSKTIKEANTVQTFPPLVTVVDRAGGKGQNQPVLDYLAPGSKEQWKPLFAQLKERMQKRGLEKTMQLGLVTDNWAYKEQVEFLKEVSGGLPWANAGHYTRDSLPNGMANFGYQSSFFGYQFDYLKSLYGWKGPKLTALFERVGLDYFPTARWRGLGEQAIMGNMRGVGRLGGDTWAVVKDKNGNRTARAWERFPGANWGYLNCNSGTLAPAAEGAVATVRYEALREGLQECEARVAIEAALTDDSQKAKVGAELAKMYQDLMVERQKAFWRSIASHQCGPLADQDDPHAWRGAVLTGHLWFVGSGWQERSEKLYSLAGEVARKVGG